MKNYVVIPSKAGIQSSNIFSKGRLNAWIPAFAGMTALVFFAQFAQAEPSVEAGKEAFGMYCARCHGPQGKGDGVDAKRLTVVPRDLTSGRFKFKTTVQGTPPSDDDMITGIVGHGLAGSGMPSFANLEKDTRVDIVAYIKSISPAFSGNIKPEPIADPANLRSKPDLAKGKETFTKLQCQLCHGPNGHANGTSAFTQMDAWGRPIRVANLTQGWTYRGGSRPIDIYHRVIAGIDGAPMPSYEGAASHEEIYQLANYIKSLQLDENWSGEVAALHVTGELPQSADDEIWKKAVRTDINMQEYLYNGNHREHLTVNAVSVQAVANEENVTLRIFWEDPIKNDKGMEDALLLAIKPQQMNADVRANLHTIKDLKAAGIETINWKASDSSIKSVYDDGRWTVLLTAKLKPSEGPRYIAFSAWDGNNGESGDKKSSSQWIHLSFGETHH